MKKRTQNMSLIGQKMDSTFVQRRKEIIHSEPTVSEIVEKCPALFTESQDSDVDAYFSGIDVGLLTILAEDTPARTSHALNVDSSRAIILEG
ncbi:hypothetical protein QTP86_033649 [Hemibagrus guttatus]|nr:hypothetical protein QTP86_033649 [Hemibagrus guttatus]